MWFPKLNILQDQFEGTLTVPAGKAMHESSQKWKETFTSPAHHKMIDEMPKQNVEDGRELMVVNCWFLGNSESQKMWDNYVGNTDGVAIKSTTRKLATYIYVMSEYSSIGKVKYVDFNSHELKPYEASQAGERAFLKNEKLVHENEVRIVTINLKIPDSVSPSGVPYTLEEVSGKNMNNFENSGLYISVNLKELIDIIILSPNATKWFELLIKRIIQLSQLEIDIQRSELEQNITKK